MTDHLTTVFDLMLARTHAARDVDGPLGSLHGISLAELAILRELREAPDGKLRRSELAQRLGITPSGIARQLGPLERIGLVGRESHDRDARLALVVLTETGARIAGEAMETAEHAAERALRSRWTDAERDRLAKLLANVRDPR
jgi:DNA-binding MarR family transcriptional regulator